MSFRNLDDDITLHHNLFSSGTNRHPTLASNEYEDYDHLADFRNNVNYNWSRNMRSGSCDQNIINNTFRFGPNGFGTGSMIDVVNRMPDPWGYLTGNVFESVSGSDATNCANYTADNYTALSYTEGDPYGPSNRSEYEAFTEFTAGGYIPPVTESPSVSFQNVVDYAGCSLLRDAVDTRMINNLVNSTGVIVDSQADVGGWDNYVSETRPAGFDTDQDGMPDIWETTRGLDPGDPDDRNDDDNSNGYTNLEEYLNELTGEVEPAEEFDPPTPDPMTWKTLPYSISHSKISMTATTASDASGVEYFFDCLTVGGHDSDWQNSPVYEDTGLSASTEYTYTVMARDKTVAQNETSASDPASATTGIYTFAPTYINFQLDTAAVPAGYIKDYGQFYGDQGNGYSYGWSSDITDEGRDRGRHADQRYDTLVHLKAVWEIALGNGKYDIDLVAGDSKYDDQINNILLEGVSLVDLDGGEGTGDHFDEYNSVVVTVSDGKLTIDEGPGGDNPKLCFLHIREYTPVYMADFARLSEYWLSGCTEGGGWCEGMDYDHADGVNTYDLQEFVSRWMDE